MSSWLTSLTLSSLIHQATQVFHRNNYQHAIVQASATVQKTPKQIITNRREELSELDDGLEQAIQTILIVKTTDRLNIFI